MDVARQQGRIVALDTETTGLSRAARFVEFAAVEVDPRTGVLGRSLHSLVDPGVPIPQEVTRIHGIRSADVAGMPGFARLAGDIVAFLRGATVAAHNASFDLRMLDAELARSGGPSLETLGVRVVDSARASLALFPLERSHKLDAVCDRLAVDRTARRTHGALLDAQLLARALPRLAVVYDTCRTVCEVPLAGMDTFVHALHDAVDDVGGPAERAISPMTRERAYFQIVAAMALLRELESEALERLSSVVPAAGWCSAQYVARWSNSETVTWKAAAYAYLSERDMQAFRSSVSQLRLSVPCAADGAGRGPRFAAVHALGGYVLATGDIVALAAFTGAVSDAWGVLDARRQALRELLIADAAGGYDLTTLHLTRTECERTDYRRAVTALAPEADLAPFTKHDERLSVRRRDFSACEVLFGKPRTEPGAAA